MKNLAPQVALMHLRRVALACLFLLPIALMHARAVAEATTSIIAITFLLRCALEHDWTWLRRPWLMLPLVLWAWVVFCSVVGVSGAHAITESIVALRYWVLVAALEAWLLRDPVARRWLWRIVAASAVWIALQCWLQYLSGSNLLGYPRWGDGSLTGPFYGPRAGSPYTVILFPALLPPVMTLLGRNTWPARIGGVLLAIFGIATLILIGQRMPALLGLLGLVAAGLLLPRFRPAVVAAMLVGAVLLASLPVTSPPTYQKLVVHFLDQMRHFPESDYGQIYQLTSTMTAGHPVTGFGFDGFRVGCEDPRWTAHPLLPVPQLLGAKGEPEGCAIHPHNFWLEAAVTGGLPALVLFAAVCALWLWRAGFRLRADPLRVGLFAAVLEKLWPIASTNAFYTMPMSGWTFLVVGWALGLAAIAAPASAPTHDR